MHYCFLKALAPSQLQLLPHQHLAHQAAADHLEEEVEVEEEVAGDQKIMGEAHIFSESVSFFSSMKKIDEPLQH